MTYGINEKRYGNTIRFTGAISPVSQNKTIPINWDNIAKVGKQAKGSVSCSCFALAYCRTRFDNKVHNLANITKMAQTKIMYGQCDLGANIVVQLGKTIMKYIH